MLDWEKLLSLKRQGDTTKRLRKEQDDARLGFEVDYDRVIFSSAFRSLQDKTQVIPLSKTDFVHTRLTHSLEVSVVGRSLGRQAGKAIIQKYPHLEKTLGYHFNDFGAIVAAASLAHDIGNPPFGHSGEKAIGAFFERGKGKRFRDKISDWAYQDLIKFEGNANGFKLLTETKNGSFGGLRLSYATLGAFTKYPKASFPVETSKHVARKKYGVFKAEKPLFDEVSAELGLKDERQSQYYRHPLAYLVEAADDICYTIIDFEDGINLGLIPEEYALEYLSKLVNQRIDKDKYFKLSTTKNRVSYLRSLAIGRLIEDAVQAFIHHEEDIRKGQLDKPLIDYSPYKAQIEDIIQISIKKIYQSQEVLEKETVGYRVITEILEHFSQAIENRLTDKANHFDNVILKAFLKDFEFEDLDTEFWLIELSSRIASLSDSKALEIYKTLSGQNL
ncbi:dGTP triphosphohydrolase [Mesohalobacter halotolerans]|uniref:DNTP triphosphohydrolase n=1 Tax=Mesohalobacter halotolerans TaxID=1883405 RepID=A0A4U5TRK0_9FLAO|nr:dNTP triphosphohydrolase [Mesohalobacter halotolerans]MBS3737422.1 dNTP triphosphohydrolase [Psychroflexus sp.]TKS56890.1 dNTP triphosphohydrolase [Mesohalobacter halotolerans]